MPLSLTTALSFQAVFNGEPNRVSGLGAVGPDEGRVRCEGEAVAGQGEAQLPRGPCLARFGGRYWSLFCLLGHEAVGRSFFAVLARVMHFSIATDYRKNYRALNTGKKETVSAFARRPFQRSHRRPFQRG